MKISLIGYGKMGKEIERIALERGHQIPCRIDIDNRDDFNSVAYGESDVAIEFTNPEASVDNIKASFNAGVRVVSGSTGWLNRYDEVVEHCNSKNLAFFYASNYSVGVNVFFELNKHLAKIMNGLKDYDVAMEEIHHTQKLDAPSGTAITLAEGIIENSERKDSWKLEEDKSSSNELPIKAIREGKVFGIHTIKYDSDVDFIHMTHNAKSRQGFALGAVLAAEYLCGKQGVFGMNDLLNF